MDKAAGKKEFLKSFLGDGRISARFRGYNIALFAIACLLIVAAMSASFYYVIREVSAEYAGRYATSSAKALSAHIAKEVSLMSKAAHSKAVIDWFADENDHEKKVLAYEEMSEVLGELYSSNLYVGFEKSLNEYQIEKNRTSSDILPFDELDKNDPEDAWYFKSAALDKDYMLDVDIDHVLQRKRVWLDYKVVRDGAVLGVISTGLEFSQLVRELLAHYDNVARGMIIDANGGVNIDSSMFDKEEFMRGNFDSTVEDEITDPVFLDAVKSYLGSIDGYFGEETGPTVIKLSPGPYRYATIAPIMYTDWTALVVYDSSSSFSMTMFLPAFMATLILMISFVLAAGAISNRLIFLPLARLVRSLALLNGSKDETIYGLERKDEFGTLSNTINDLFIRAIRDGLTNLYNRRYMENALHDMIDFLSRSNGHLSVLMLDIDFFKKYNDTYGHEQGDVCLRSVAHALAGCVTRANDFVARYGGEEFIAVLPNTDEAGARAIAQKMLESVRGLDMPHAANSAAPCVTVSVGVTTGEVVYTDNWEDFVKSADEALYASKQNGRNRCTYLPFTRVSGK